METIKVYYLSTLPSSINKGEITDLEKVNWAEETNNFDKGFIDAIIEDIKDTQKAIEAIEAIRHKIALRDRIDNDMIYYLSLLKEAVQRRTKKGKSKDFNSLFLCEEDFEKEKYLKKLHAMIDGKKGKDVALILKSAISAGLIIQPTFTIVKNEFGEIGSKTGFDRYMNRSIFKKEEMQPIIKQLKTNN